MMESDLHLLLLYYYYYHCSRVLFSIEKMQELITVIGIGVN